MRTIIIPKGEGRIAIAERLEREGVITNRWTFVGGYLLQGYLGGRRTGDLKAGEYQINAHASMRDVIDTLAAGKSILYKTTLPEGLTSEQIVDRLKAEPSLSGEITSVPPEGTLLPNTYYFSKGTSRNEILDRMRSDMEKMVTALWDQRDPDIPVRSMDELITFASIVEKETGRSDERDRVAAVFYNRLRKGMRLQSDPTIIYGIAGGQGALGRGITKADIETKSPYNTYQINGLPPGPICNPGKSTILAALHPAKTNDLYFVADGSGGHTFSETLKEHNNAVQKWRKVEKAKQDAAVEQDAAPIPSQTAKSTTSKDQKSAKANVPSSGASDGDGDASPTSDDASDMPLPVRKPKRQ
jgi:UPF0755 protein